MSSDFYERRTNQLRRDLEREMKKRADFEAKAAKAEEAASKAESAALKASSSSSTSSKLKEAERKRNEAIKAKAEAAKTSSKAADFQKKIHEAERKVNEERSREQKSEQRKTESKQRSEMRREQMAEQRRTQQERAREAAREREFTELAVRTESLEAELEKAQLDAPKQVTALFLAGTIEGGEFPLRLDQEVREIQKRVRESEHRDAIKIEYALATRVSDILQALNEHQPDIVHFAGHGSDQELLFEGNDGQPLALSNEQLGLFLQAAPKPIRLVVFNSCESSEQAALACNFVSAAIGMDESVADASAKEFAGQFYGSLGFGLDLAKSFLQAQAQAKVIGDGSGQPHLYTADGVKPEELVLVAPPS